MSQPDRFYAEWLLQRVQLGIERRTVHHDRFETRLLNWNEYYCLVGHRPDPIYRQPVIVPIPARQDAFTSCKVA